MSSIMTRTTFGLRADGSCWASTGVVDAFAAITDRATRSFPDCMTRLTSVFSPNGAAWPSRAASLLSIGGGRTRLAAVERRAAAVALLSRIDANAERGGGRRQGQTVD